MPCGVECGGMCERGEDARGAQWLSRWDAGLVDGGVRA